MVAAPAARKTQKILVNKGLLLGLVFGHHGSSAYEQQPHNQYWCRTMRVMLKGIAGNGELPMILLELQRQTEDDLQNRPSAAMKESLATACDW